MDTQKIDAENQMKNIRSHIFFSNTLFQSQKNREKPKLEREFLGHQWGKHNNEEKNPFNTNLNVGTGGCGEPDYIAQVHFSVVETFALARDFSVNLAFIQHHLQIQRFPTMCHSMPIHFFVCYSCVSSWCR